MTASNVVNLNQVRQRKQEKANRTPVSNTVKDDLEFSFSNEVDKDIDNLMRTTGLERQEAIDLAKNFYRTYPMLVEFVRSPNELLKK